MTQNTTPTQQPANTPAQKKPNETGSISVEGHVRIFDPKTKEVYVEKRA
jgi:hypothetical protein